METKFQTSFIPKKSLIPDQTVHRPRGGTSVFMTISVLIFILSLAGAGSTFFLKSYLLNSQKTLQADLEENQKRFDIPTIENLKNANTKIDLTTKILKDHVAISEVFNILSRLTIDGVYFEDFELTSGSTGDANASANANQGVYSISMSGVANSYSSVAFQSDVFGSSDEYGTNKIIKNPVISDLSTNEDDNVGFKFKAEIDTSNITYEKVLMDMLRAEGLIPPEVSGDTENTASSTETLPAPNGNNL